MKRARPIAFAALVISLSSFAHPAGAQLSIPLAATAELCAASGMENGAPHCHRESLVAGTNLAAFVERNSQAGKRYRLALQLPAGEFVLDQTWRIDGATLPERIEHLSISGSLPFTRLSGARDVDFLRARVRTVSGISIIELPESWRRQLAPKARYTSEETAWPSLYDSSGPLRLTRWPREGWAEFTRPETAPANSIRLGDEAPAASWNNEHAAWALGFFRFGWHAGYAPLTAIDESSALSMSGFIRYGVGNSGYYRVLNLRTELRRPGDYWIEDTGNLHFMPHAGASAGSIRVAVLAKPMLVLSHVRSVDVAGIEFSATRGDGVVVDRSADVNLSQLRFADIGRAALIVDGGHNVRVRDSTFEDIGDQAVILRGGDRATLEGSGHAVENSRIVRPSQRLLTPATAIRLEGVGHLVRGNVIEDVPQLAVYFDGNDHVIDSNWFERICVEVDDAGAIYAGRDWTARGTVIRNNVFTNIRATRKPGNATAIYLDDMLSGIRVENNLMVDVDTGVLVGGGRDNVVERNVFYRARVSVHVDDRARTWAQKAVARGEVMDQRLNAVPVRSARWRAAYPELAAMPRGDAATPAGNEVRDNLAVSGRENFVAGAVTAGVLQPPGRLELPGDVRTASELLAFCSTGSNCKPFEAHLAAQSVLGAVR